MSKSLTAAVIGCGNISTFHFSGLAKAGARIKWVCDLNEAAARPWAAKFDARFTADYRELLADPEVDLVNVTSIARTHKAMCLDVIATGKAVICEKTLAENAEDAYNQEYRFDAESPFDRAIAFFCANIAQGQQGAQSRWTGYEADELIAHIKQSAASGQAVEITWKQGTRTP